MKSILIATKNKGKAAEFKSFFNKYQIKTISLLDLPDDIPDVEETGTSFAENAALKAEQISSLFNISVLADDSGLIVDALHGRPGIYSARYAGEEKSDRENMEKVLNELVGIPLEKRTARFICVLALARPGEETIFRTGYCEGVIAFSEAGTNGFGYDPIFIPTSHFGKTAKGHFKTMAEISDEEKSKLSHRSNAIVQLEEWIRENKK